VLSERNVFSYSDHKKLNRDIFISEATVDILAELELVAPVDPHCTSA
jgi:hypothetical protein